MRFGLASAQRVRNLFLWLIGSFLTYCFVSSVTKYDVNQLNSVQPRPMSLSSSSHHFVTNLKPQKRESLWLQINATKSSLPANDLKTLINITDFKFLINSNRCQPNQKLSTYKKDEESSLDTSRSGDSVYLVVFVHSRPSNFARREQIRHTWGNESLFASFSTKLRVVYMLGDSANASVQSLIEEEQVRHGDIVQGNFIDSYRNLTYKHVMGEFRYNWIRV